MPVSRPSSTSASLDLGVTVGLGATGGAELANEVVGEPHRAVEQTRVAADPVVGDSRLEQVPRAVESLARPRQILIAVVEPRGVEVAVGVLRVHDGLGDVVESSFEVGVGMGGERPRRGFHPLVDVGVGEEQALALTVHGAHDAAEVVDGAVGLEPLEQRVPPR